MWSVALTGSKDISHHLFRGKNMPKYDFQPTDLSFASNFLNQKSQKKLSQLKWLKNVIF